MVAMVIGRRLACVVALAAGVTCTGDSAPSQSNMTPGPGAPPVRVLLFSATAGFHHESIETARRTLTARAASSGEFTVTLSENVADLTASRLATVDVVFFAMTSGELPLDEAEKAALLAFVSSGHGFIGTHSATDTLYDWPAYRDLVGAQFKEHPWTQTATVSVEDQRHATTAGLGSAFQLEEEFYTFRENPRPSSHVLLALDPASVGASGGDFPLAWTRAYGQGRVYYNALGHFPSTWTDERFLRKISAAILWTAQR